MLLYNIQIPRICRFIFLFVFALALNYLSTSRSIKMSTSSGKKVIQIDVSSDSVCPACFMGKKNLDKAIASSHDKYTFEIKWHPFILNPSAPKEGILKKELFQNKFGARAQQIISQEREMFARIGVECDSDGLTGNTLESHRIIYFAGKQGHEKQHKLVEEIYSGYFSHGKFIGDREFLVQCAEKVGVDGAAEFLADPNNGVKEVKEEIRKYSSGINGVPHYVINGKYKLSGGQPPEVFLRAFQAAGSS